jgi:hypothetical protein
MQGSGVIAPCILNLNIRWTGVVSYTFLILNPWEKALGSHGIGGWVGP